MCKETIKQNLVLIEQNKQILESVQGIKTSHAVMASDVSHIKETVEKNANNIVQNTEFRQNIKGVLKLASFLGVSGLVGGVMGIVAFIKS